MKVSEELVERLAVQRERLCLETPELASRFVEIACGPSGLQIPFLPIRAFREFEIVSCGRHSAEGFSGGVIRFLSSGTTQAKRGVHLFSEAGIKGYALGAVEGFERFLARFGFGRDTPVVSLVPPETVWPQSSLAAMVAMFACAGFDIRYADVEGDEERLRSVFGSVVPASDLVVFGTSFHHLLLERRLRASRGPKLVRCRRLGVIDTGGTKGRTEAVTPEAMRALVADLYGGSREFLFLSEYGMCELASQAYSSRAPHDGRFVCNPGLIAVSVDISGRSELSAGERGFLGFVDSRNRDSFMAVLTEDVGLVLPDQDGCSSFELCGRAPDASIKGCSLNVREELFSTIDRRLALEDEPENVCGVPSGPRTFLAAFGAGFAERVIGRLGSDVWSAFQLAELSSALHSVEGASDLAVGRALGRQLQIVASANIPITWLFPTIAAAALGYDEVVINLPSLRPDDPFSTRVRRQIDLLAKAVACEIEPVSLRLVDSSLLAPGDCRADVLVVFGSDATCAAFARRFSSVEGLQLLTFGDLYNSLSVVDGRPSQGAVASLCAAWQGRGCLTPLVIFNPDGLSDTDRLAEDLAAGINAALLAAAPQEHAESRFLHAHDLLEIEAVLTSAGVGRFVRIIREGAATVVDLRRIFPSKLQSLPIHFTCAGAGMVFLLGDRNDYPWLSWISSYPCRPGIRDAHMGKSWFEWLGISPEPLEGTDY